jgi:hypothetical protein
MGFINELRMTMQFIPATFFLLLSTSACKMSPPTIVKQVSDVQSSGELVGTVSKGPVLPAVRPGEPLPPAGVGGAEIDIAPINGEPFTSVKTDSNGAFRVKLPVGTYRVTMHSMYGAMFSRDVPTSVTIVAGQQQHLDIHLDTGIR